jgi:arylsulfatase A-like enzyme
VLLVSDARGRKVNRQDLTLMDIGPTVLKLQGIKPPFTIDGKSFLEGV